MRPGDKKEPYPIYRLIGFVPPTSDSIQSVQIRYVAVEGGNAPTKETITYNIITSLDLIAA